MRAQGEKLLAPFLLNIVLKMAAGRWLGWAFLIVMGIGCGRRAVIFTTPHDKELRRALRRQGQGWVSAGYRPMDTVQKNTKGVLLPGQFVRVVMELSRPLSEETAEWVLVRMDTLRIYEDSMVYVPWGGSARLGGLSLDSARVVLQSMADRIFTGARLRIYPMYAYYLFGQVAQQGRVLYDRAQIPLTELLAMVPIQTREADLSQVKVLRGPPAYSQVFLVDVRSAGILTGAFLLQAEDIVVFEPRGIVRSRIELQNLLAVIGLLQILNLLLLIPAFFRR